MIEKIFIISFIVFAIHYTMLPGEIFGKLGNWFADNLPGAIHKPVFDCPVCMGFWYGTIIYWLVWGLWLCVSTWQEWIVCAIGVVGLNFVLSKLFPDKDD